MEIRVEVSVRVRIKRITTPFAILLQEIADAKKQNILLSLHLKATMMKVRT